MSKINIANLKKTIYYLKRNGLRDTYLAALERLRRKEDAYTYCPPSPDTLKEQMLLNDGVLFSILVPAYRTKEEYLRAMVESVLAQSYGRFELIVADAGCEEGPHSVSAIMREYTDERIRYLKLQENGGIAQNSNAALDAARGDYIGLLDHDDLLTPDALFEMAAAIGRAKEAGITLRLLYSDEDKCDENGASCYEPHFKPDFNLDLILSNHYICHFMVMQASLMKKLRFRSAFDGAQDHDLVLRGIGEILCPLPVEEMNQSERARQRGVGTIGEEQICHIPKVLYHWRCHRRSTAENPQSKQYAYDAGGRAIADFLQETGIKGKVLPTKHLGFFKVEYEPDILAARADVGAVGGRLVNRKGKITGGIYKEDGVCPFEGLPAGYSGYMHRASLQQDAAAADIRLMRIRPKLYETVKEVLTERGFEWKGFRADGTLQDFERQDCPGRPFAEEEYREASLAVCRKIREKGYRIVWIPEWTKRI